MLNLLNDTLENSRAAPLAGRNCLPWRKEECGRQRFLT
jgi:hypothetical protein